MNSVKRWITLAAIAAAVSLHVVAEFDPFDICDQLNRALSKHADIKDDRKDALEFAKNWIKNDKFFPSHEKNKIIKAWEEIYADEKCSKSAWQYLVDLSTCKNVSMLKVLNEPMKKYAKTCLKPKNMIDKVKAAGKNKVNFLDVEFISKYHETNPSDIPMHVNFVSSPLEYQFQEFCCRALKSLKAVRDAIQRDLKNNKRDLKKEFSVDPNAVSKYLTKKLFAPCKSLKLSFNPLVKEMAEVGKYYEGGVEALIGLLDQNTKNILFRYKYCDTLGNAEEQLFVSEVQKFLRS